MKAKQRVLIECGGAHVSVGVVSLKGNPQGEASGTPHHAQLDAYAREDFVCPPAHAAAWAAQVAAALDTVCTRLGLARPLRDAPRLALPGHLALTKLVTTPAVAPADLAQAIRFEATRSIPFALDQVAWAGIATRHDTDEIALLISAAKLAEVEPLCAATDAAQVPPAHCEPAALALWRALSTEIHEPVLLVDVGARSTQVIIGEAGREWPSYLRTLHFGGNHVTQALAQSLHCDFPEAEAAKRRMAQAAAQPPQNAQAEPIRQSEALLREKVEHAVAAFSQKLATELLLTRLGSLRQSATAVSAARILLCGGGAALPGLAQTLAETLGLPVSELPPPAALRLAPSLVQMPPPAASDLYTLYGLALGAKHPADSQVNLLPESRRAQHEARASRPRWLAAAALLAILPLPLLLYQRAALAQVRREIAAADARTAPLLRLSTSNAQAQAERDALKTQLAQLRALEVGRSRWPHFLAELQTRLHAVGDVWLEKLHYTPSENNDAAAPSEESIVLGEGRIEISGWLLETRPAEDAMQRLFEALSASGVVREITRERYDRSRSGVLHFDAELLVAPEAPPPSATAQ